MDMLQALLGQNQGPTLPHPVPGGLPPPQPDAGAMLNALAPKEPVPTLPPKAPEPKLSNVGKLVRDHFSKQEKKPGKKPLISVPGPLGTIMSLLTPRTPRKKAQESMPTGY